MTRGIIFDLDDTLYFEKDYVMSGFKYIAETAAKSLHPGLDADTIFHYLAALFSGGTRGNTFDLLLKDFPSLNDAFCVDNLVEMYRSHKPRISMSREVVETLLYLKEKGYLLGIITDGPLISQRNKVEALELEKYMDNIIFTDIWGRDSWKPDPRSFEEMSKTLATGHSELCYVGDNPAKDFRAPLKLGWECVFYHNPGQLRYHKNHEFNRTGIKWTISSLKQLMALY